MDWSYMGQLMLRVAIITPGAIIFGILLFVGLLVMLEKSGAFAALQKDKLATAGALDAGNPPAEQIISELKQSVEAEKLAENEEEAQTGT